MNFIKPDACYLRNKAFAQKYALHQHVENMHAKEQSTGVEENLK